MLARRRLVGAHPRAEADRPALPALRALRRPGADAIARVRLEPRRGRGRGKRARGERERARPRRSSARPGPTSSRRQARSEDYRERAAAYRAVGQFRFRQKDELLRRGLEDDSPACRGSALLSLELLSREHPRSVNSVRPLLHNLANADDNEAVRRLAILALRNGSPQRDTIVLLQGIAEEEGISQETRQTAAKVAAGLDKRAKTR